MPGLKKSLFAQRKGSSEVPLNGCYGAILYPKSQDRNSDAGQGLVGPLQVGVSKKNLAEGFIGYQFEQAGNALVIEPVEDVIE